MRTTIDLPDDLHSAATAIAKDAGLSMSGTIARMVRGFFPPPATAEEIRAMIAEDEDDEIDW